jgi:hypothetical protein
MPIPAYCPSRFPALERQYQIEHTQTRKIGTKLTKEEP